MKGTATYSPEDNKLRLYPFRRLSAEDYALVKAAGFSWAPKQELFVAPAWTPAREDLLLELCGEIEDEDKSLVERAEERAERFEDYSDKRGTEAERARQAVSQIADAIPLGQPILVGHHSEKHARKDKERIESGMRKAVHLWRTSQYWLDRAAGALHHAKYKEKPAVRARRIKTLEADRRKMERAKAEAEAVVKLWARDMTHEEAYNLAGRSSFYAHVCPGPEGRSYGWTAYDVLAPDEKRYKDCPAMTVAQVREALNAVCARQIDNAERWIAHLDNRLAYERAMLAEAGGIEADKVKPEKGGACRCWASPGHGRGWSLIQKVNKVSVTVLDNWGNGGRDFTRTIPFDKLPALMSKAQVDEARAAGRLADETPRGFYLLDEPAKERPARVEPEATPFDAMEAALKQGVQVVTAPQLFPTPPEIAAQAVTLAEIHEGHNILEPSAGTGNLIRAIRAVAPEARVEACEINRQLADKLGRLAQCVINADFLEWTGDPEAFDRVIMNPPFGKAEDIKHVEHALTKLRPGGRLVSIVANGPRQREKLEPLATAWIDLPPGSFKEQGTGVNAAIVVIDKEAEGPSKPVTSLFDIAD